MNLCSVNFHPTPVICRTHHLCLLVDVFKMLHAHFPRVPFQLSEQQKKRRRGRKGGGREAEGGVGTQTMSVDEYRHAAASLISLQAEVSAEMTFLLKDPDSIPDEALQVVEAACLLTRTEVPTPSVTAAIVAKQFLESAFLLKRLAELEEITLSYTTLAKLEPYVAQVCASPLPPPPPPAPLPLIRTEHIVVHNVLPPSPRGHLYHPFLPPPPS